MRTVLCALVPRKVRAPLRLRVVREGARIDEELAPAERERERERVRMAVGRDRLVADGARIHDEPHLSGVSKRSPRM
jgi:hypothetical protein